jgi:hypothetical protein
MIMTEQARAYLLKKETERDNKFWNLVGFSSGLIIIICIIIMGWITLIHTKSASAGELDAWEFHFFGINAKDFQNRNPWKIVGGGILSIAAHEVVGHMLASEMTGMGHSCLDFQNGYLVAMSGDGYNDASDDQRAWFAASGMVVQSLGSLILTSIPKTRHSDWTLGWNLGTTVVGFQYALFDGGNDNFSDTINMEVNGWPGTEIAWGTTAIGVATSYISLNKNHAP